MHLVTIEASDGGQTGALIEGQVLNFAKVGEFAPAALTLPADMMTLLEDMDEYLETARRVTGEVGGAADPAKDSLRQQGALTALEDTKLTAPIPRPSLLMSSGRNYRSHMVEMAAKEGRELHFHDEPIARMVNPRGVIGHGTAIELPPKYPDMVDWECEFTVVFGRRCFDIEESEVVDCIAGYTLYNDVSARDWNASALNKETGERDWTFVHLGKNPPTFGPLGPCIATKDERPDPDATRIKTLVNGEVMQDSSTEDLCFTIARTISYFSQWFEFHPGDLFATGSPPGVGFSMKPPKFLKEGDVCELWGEGIGTLSNPVIRGGK